MIGRITVAVFIAGFAISVHAGEINPNAPAETWRSKASSDRLAYATMTTVMCRHTGCNGLAVNACMNEVTRPPAPPGLSSLTIGEIAIKCIKILNGQ